MMSSKELSKLIGPTLSVMTLSEMINLSIWRDSIPALIYLNGILLFVAGISIVRVHNHWKKDWTMLITLVGWSSLIAGLYRIFFPRAPQADERTATYAGLIFLFTLGLFLTFKGYTSRSDARRGTQG